MEKAAIGVPPQVLFASTSWNYRFQHLDPRVFSTDPRVLPPDPRVLHPDPRVPDPDPRLRYADHYSMLAVTLAERQRLSTITRLPTPSLFNSIGIPESALAQQKRTKIFIPPKSPDPVMYPSPWQTHDPPDPGGYVPPDPGGLNLNVPQSQHSCLRDQPTYDPAGDCYPSYQLPGPIQQINPTLEKQTQQWEQQQHWQQQQQADEGREWCSENELDEADPEYGADGEEETDLPQQSQQAGPNIADWPQQSQQAGPDIQMPDTNFSVEHPMCDLPTNFEFNQDREEGCQQDYDASASNRVTNPVEKNSSWPHRNRPPSRFRTRSLTQNSSKAYAAQLKQLSCGTNNS